MKVVPSAEEKWHALVVDGDTDLLGRKHLTKFYGLIPTSARCRICNLPFAGFSGKVMHLLGKKSSRINQPGRAHETGRI